MKHLVWPFRSAVALGVCVAVLVGLSAPAVGRDRPAGAWLPVPGRLSRTVEVIGRFSAETLAEQVAGGEGSAAECRRSATIFACQCVHMQLGDATIQAVGLQRDGSAGTGRRTITARQVRVTWNDRPDDQTYFIGHYIARDSSKSAESPGVVYRLDAMNVIHPSRPLSVLTVGQLDLSDGADPGRLHLRDLQWRPAGSSRSATSCGFSWSAPEGTATVSADDAAVRTNRWVVHQVDRAGPAPALARVVGSRPGRVSGFLPPAITWSQDIGHLSQSYLYADWGLAPTVAVAPGHWYGLGVGVASDLDESSRTTATAGVPPVGNSTDLVDVQLRWSEHTRSLEPAVVGDGRWGDPYTHVAGSFEEVGDRRFWTIDRVDRRALLRPWRFSRVGVSLAGPSHTLSLRAVHPHILGPSRAGPDDVAVDPEMIGAQLRLAVHHQLSEAAATGLEIRHASLADGGRDTHQTTVEAGIDRTFGSPGAVYVRPALRGWLESTFENEPGGLTTTTRGQMVATAEAGVAIRGRFGQVVHRIEPSVIAAREVAGFARRDTAAADVRWPDHARRDGWTLGGVRLDQTLAMDSALSIDVPAALVIQGSGFDQAVGARPTALGGWELHSGPLRASLHAACPQLQCDQATWTADGAARWSWIGLIYMSGNATSWPGSPGQQPAVWRDDWGGIDRVQGIDAAEQTRRASLSHLAGLQWLGEPIRGQLRGFWTPATTSTGVSGALTYAARMFGWSVSLQGQWRPDTHDWGASIGLSTSRTELRRRRSRFDRPLQPLAGRYLPGIRSSDPR